MRTLVLVLSLAVGSSSAVAQSTPGSRANAPAAPPTTKTPVSATVTASLSPIDLATIPDACHALARQAGTARLPAALAARSSLARCLATAKLAKLVLVDCEESVLAVDEATRQSFELFDEVIANAPDAVTKIVVEQAKADLYTNLAVRMLATIPAPGTTEASIAMHRARKAILDAWLVRWRDGAARSYEHILELAKREPVLEKNPVVAAAVRTAKDRLRLHVASAASQPQPATPPSSTTEPAPAGPKPAPDRDAPMTDTGETLR
jgi:hypothetical protein